MHMVLQSGKMVEVWEVEEGSSLLGGVWLKITIMLLAVEADAVLLLLIQLASFNHTRMHSKGSKEMIRDETHG